MKVLIVGNSPHLNTLNENKGHIIDEYFVVRFNHAIYYLNNNTGFKTNIHCINGIDVYKKNNTKKLVFDNSLINRNFFYNLVKDAENITIVPTAFFDKMHKKFAYTKSKISNGLLTILYFLYEKHFKRVYITNFEFSLGKMNHDYDFVPSSQKHDWELEKSIVDDLISQNMVIKIL